MTDFREKLDDFKCYVNGDNDLGPFEVDCINNFVHDLEAYLAQTGNLREHTRFDSLEAHQNLFEAVEKLVNFRQAMRVVQNYAQAQQAYNDLAGAKDLLEELEAAFKASAAFARTSETLQGVRNRAKQLYEVGDDIELDDTRTYYNGSTGHWVGAFLWVPDEEDLETPAEG